MSMIQGLLQMSDGLIVGFQVLLLVNDHRVMMRVQALCDDLRVSTLVVVRFLKSYGEGVQLSLGQRADHRRYQAGIQTSAVVSADRNIADQTKAHGIQ